MPTPEICVILKQNQRLFQIQNPPIRLEIPNPYLLVNNKTGKNNTAFELNMRRKTEILKYAPNKQSTQTNSLTKSQKWNQIVSGNYQNESYTIINKNGKTYLNGQIVNKADASIKVRTCPPKPTLTTACNVPGPPIYLYEDPLIPLYNYATNINSYAIDNQITSPNWYIESYRDIVSTITIPSSELRAYIENNLLYTTGYTTPITIASLYIVAPKYSLTTFNMTIPIGFYLAGNISSKGSYKKSSSILIKISSLRFTILSNNNIVPSYSQYNITVPDIYYDVSINIPITATDSIYSIGKYIGDISINNIVLPTSSGMIYDFQLSYIFNISNIDLSYNIYIDKTVAGIISNITKGYTSNNYYATSSIDIPIPVVNDNNKYVVIKNPTNGFAFNEM